MSEEHFRQTPPESSLSGEKKTAEFWRTKKWMQKEILRSGSLIRINAREGFELREELAKRKKAVEIAGPTNTGYDFHDIRHPDEDVNLAEGKKLFISNLYPGAPMFFSDGTTFEGKTDFIADSRTLPLKEGAVDILYCSCLGEIAKIGIERLTKVYPAVVPKQEKERVSSPEGVSGGGTTKLREETLREAWRLLPFGGMLVWQGGTAHDIAFALQIGFTILQREEKDDQDGEPPVQNLIFVKEQLEVKS